MKFILLHGSFGSPDGNWIPYLKTQLKQLGHESIVPRFPVNTWDEVTQNGPRGKTDKQNLNNWLTTFKPVYEKVKNEDVLYVVGHSLACVFTLHLVEHFNIAFNQAFFVAPFLERLGKNWQIDVANETFYKKNFDFELMRKNIPKSTVLYGDDDPYVARNFIDDFADKMASKKIMVHEGKHLNREAGYTKFPLLLNVITENITSFPSVSS